MRIDISGDKYELGMKAGMDAAQVIVGAIQDNEKANIIMATGSSQLLTIEHLVADPRIDWSKVTMFHLDEYIGLPESSPASFRGYLKKFFLSKLPALQLVYLINGETDPYNECRRLNEAISQVSIDLALVGIGENGHLAFNDPPADFETTDPYIVVNLDEACRNQQLGEGWFETLDEVPRQAISMSVHQIMKSKAIICSVPEARKATAVTNCLKMEISNYYPASILRQHPDCVCYLDRDSSAGLG